MKRKKPAKKTSLAEAAKELHGKTFGESRHNFRWAVQDFIREKGITDKETKSALVQLSHRYGPGYGSGEYKSDALLVLRGIGDKRVAPVVQQVFLHDNFTLTKIEAVKTLSALKAKEAVPDIKEAILSKQSHGLLDEELRREIIKALVKIDPPELADILVEALSHNQGAIRLEIMDALGELGDKKAVPHLIRNLKGDPPGAYLSHASRALGNIGDKRAINPLFKVLNNYRGRVRVEAVKAIYKLMGAKAKPHLVRQFEGGAALFNPTPFPVTVRLDEPMRRLSDEAAPLYAIDLDDAGEGFSCAGAWEVLGGEGHHAGPTRRQARKLGSTAHWTAVSPSDDRYTVFACIPSYPKAGLLESGLCTLYSIQFRFVT